MIPKIIAYIIAKNNQDNILSCLQLAKKFTNDIILIDNNSNDNTISIAKKYIRKENIYNSTLSNNNNIEISHSYNWLVYFFPHEYISHEAIDEMLYITHSELPKQYVCFYHKLLNYKLNKTISYGLLTLPRIFINALNIYQLSLRMVNLNMLTINDKITLHHSSTARYIMNEPVYLLRK